MDRVSERRKKDGDLLRATFNIWPRKKRSNDQSKMKLDPPKFESW